MNILFVCSGNVSRSFLAEMLLKNEIRRNRIEDIHVASAGTHAYRGAPADPSMVDYLIAMNVPVENHGARPVTKENIEWADRILAMEKAHVRIIEELCPEKRDKIELLAGYISADQAEDDIPDPFGRSPYHYRLAQSQITLAVKALAKTLEALPPWG